MKDRIHVRSLGPGSGRAVGVPYSPEKHLKNHWAASFGSCLLPDHFVKQHLDFCIM